MSDSIFYLSRTKYGCIYKEIEKRQGGIFAAIFDGQNVAYGYIPYNHLAKVYTLPAMEKDIGKRFAISPVNKHIVHDELALCSKVKYPEDGGNILNKEYWLSVLYSRYK